MDWPDRYAGSIVRMGSQFPSHCTATVHSVFRHTLNFMDDSNHTICSLTSRNVPMHPCLARMLPAAGVEAHTVFQGIKPGNRLRCVGDLLFFDCGRWVSFRGANRTDWHDEHPMIPDTIDQTRLKTLGDLVSRQQQMLGSQVRLAGIGNYLSCDPYAKILTDIYNAWKIRDSALSISHASRLIGLGEGYTPSGDDMVCGMACAVWMRAAMGSAHPLFSTTTHAAAWCKDLYNLACKKHLTHDMSLSMLKHAAQGLFGESLVVFANGLSREDLDHHSTIEEISSVLAATGHSSGLDAATGFLFAIDPIACMERRLYAA